MKQENLSELWLVLLTTLIENLEITSDFQKICLQVRFSPSCLLKSSSTEKLTFTRVVPSPVFLLGTRREKKKKKEDESAVVLSPASRIFPLAWAGLIFLKAASSIRIKPPDRANRRKHKSARRSASRFVRRSGGGRRPRPIPLLPPSLPPLPGSK